MANHTGTFVCLFCSGVISLRSGDCEKFKIHMEVYHEVFSHFDIILATHFLRGEEKENIIKAVENRIEKVRVSGIKIKLEMLESVEQSLNGDCAEDIGQELKKTIEDGKQTKGGGEKFKDMEESVSKEIFEKQDISDKDKENGTTSIQKGNLNEYTLRTNIETVYEEHIDEDDETGIIEEACKDDYISAKDDMVIENNWNTVQYNEEENSYDGDVNNSFCKHCKRRFQDLEKHIKNKGCFRYFQCDICHMKYDNLTKLKRHLHESKNSCFLKMSNGELKYEAKYMDDEEISDIEKAITLHGKTDLICKQCNMRFNNRKHLQNHTVRKTCLKSYVCEKCGKEFNVRSKLRRHIQDIQKPCTNKTDKIHCQECGIIFKDRRSLRRHMDGNKCITILETV